MGCGAPCGSRGGGPVSRPFARASASPFERKVFMMRNKKGFTLAELLIVVAIIAVLTAVAVPVFSAQLEKSRERVDEANLRSAYSLAMAHHLLYHPNDDSEYSILFGADDAGNLAIVYCHSSFHSAGESPDEYANGTLYSKYPNSCYPKSKTYLDSSGGDALFVKILNGQIISDSWTGSGS